jgi:hypothetical protein
MDLDERKIPSLLPTSGKPFFNVEGLNVARTKMPNRFSILLD